VFSRAHSDQWPKWACRRAPGNGGTARTLAGSVRSYAYHYTRFQQERRPSGRLSERRILGCLAFLSSAAISAFGPHQSISPERVRERVRFPKPLARRAPGRRQPRARVMPEVPVVGHRDDRKRSDGRFVLALHELRRSVERFATLEPAGRVAAMVMIRLSIA
jgi:hypothetical protein